MSTFRRVVGSGAGNPLYTIIIFPKVKRSPLVCLNWAERHDQYGKVLGLLEAWTYLFLCSAHGLPKSTSFPGGVNDESISYWSLGRINCAILKRFLVELHVW
jgi:hypothetical protein